MHRQLGSERHTTFLEALAAQASLEKRWNWGLDYFFPGFYFTHLRRYRPELASGRLKIVLLEDLQADPRRVMREFFELLEVDPDFSVPGLELRHNVSANPGAAAAGEGLTCAPAKGGRRRPLDPELRQVLVEVCREDVLRLQDLLGRDLSAWLR